MSITIPEPKGLYRIYTLRKRESQLGTVRLSGLQPSDFMG
jgi:hypothetical protein